MTESEELAARARWRLAPSAGDRCAGRGAARWIRPLPARLTDHDDRGAAVQGLPAAKSIFSGWTGAEAFGATVAGVPWPVYRREEPPVTLNLYFVSEIGHPYEAAGRPENPT
ncbi:hypothetical protein Sru01_02990 [Sphaerisporangium rufum]|uniref:Uncharacterized protein n=1 Tax=Sphaerisporangium rufum TaxID=1381558 RepID=A0A919QWM4_9ACTN|nr:hypothetical protein [Sphaerisporangium rufum]GII75317.1 hypothetical protein Sru01_02990 [Sphaerisporangium rufum]